MSTEAASSQGAPSENKGKKKNQKKGEEHRVLSSSQSERQVLSKIRQGNRNGLGPWLRRADFVHVKLVNLSRSIGFQLQMDNLPNLENMMTNFNQIVI